MMKLLKGFLTLIISICFVSICTGGTIDPAIPDAKYIEYGKNFDCIVSICGINTKNNVFCGSAVIIDENHVLTAAHVVNDAKFSYILHQDKKHIISKIIIHKNFDETFGVADIAIAYTEDIFKLDVYPSLYVDTDEVGQVCSISGYGLTGTFITGATISDNQKRAGLNKIINTEKDMLICDVSYKDSENYTNLEFFIASGDSGGGLFIDDKLAGIHSCIISVGKTNPKSKYGEESGHTRVSKFIEWINENKKAMD